MQALNFESLVLGPVLTLQKLLGLPLQLMKFAEYQLPESITLVYRLPWGRCIM